MYYFPMHPLKSLQEQTVEIHSRSQSKSYHSSGHFIFMDLSKKIKDIDKDLIQRDVAIIVKTEHNVKM